MNADRIAAYTRSEVQLERLSIENGSKQQRIGARGERLARLYLRLHGYRILQRNYRVAHKEIDIIAKKGSTVAFVEVKTALDSKELPPMLRVGSAKRANMAYAAKYFAANYRQKAVYYRFDIIEVILSEHKIRHLRFKQNKKSIIDFSRSFQFCCLLLFFAFGTSNFEHNMVK